MHVPEARGWTVSWYDRDRVCDQAAEALGCDDLNAVLAAMGRAVGPPWQAKHKLAAAAALAQKKAQEHKPSIELKMDFSNFGGKK